jgi:hypothetical protein
LIIYYIFNIVLISMNLSIEDNVRMETRGFDSTLGV